MAAQSKSLLRSYAFHSDTNQGYHDIENLLYPAGVKRRSTQVNKTQVKSCGSKLAAMGTMAAGSQPTDLLQV